MEQDPDLSTLISQWKDHAGTVKDDNEVPINLMEMLLNYLYQQPEKKFNNEL